MSSSSTESSPDARSDTRWDPGASACLTAKVEIAFGRGREDKAFRNVTSSLGQLFEPGGVFAGFEPGPKDGRCILQGGLIGGHRIAKNVTKNFIVMLDHDNGESLVEIADKIRASSLFAVLWTTFSHMGCETQIAEAVLLKWCQKNGSGSTPTPQDAARFLMATKGVKPSIFENVELKLARTHLEGGVKYVLTHAPMPRLRSLFLLETPFDFANRGGSQSEAIKEWSDRYRGLSRKLGLTADRSCADPSRLMYVPRVPPGTDLEAVGHKILVLPGAFLDLGSVPRIADMTKTAASRGTAGAARKPGPFKTPGLAVFLRDHAGDFEAADWLRGLAPEDIRRDQGNKIEFRCPNEDGHSEQKVDDRGFFVVNASDATGGGFAMGCLHNTCKEASKSDRAWYLDALCQHYGAGIEALKEHCPAASETKDERDALREITGAATFSADYPDVDSRRDLMGRIAKAWQGDADRKMIAKTMAQALGSGELRHALMREIKDADGVAGAGAPPPDDPDVYDGPIDPAWDAKVQLAVAASQLHRRNEDSPQLFRGAAAPVVRLMKNARGVVLDKVATSAQWRNVMTKTLEFGAGGHFPQSLVDCMKGHTGFSFPVLSRVIDVPVFAKDGTLKTDTGYHAELEAWLEPSITYFGVPDAASDEDYHKARKWIDEAIRDFPFSDVCGGGEIEPIYVEGSDDREGWKLPNLNRGPSSRAHFYALMFNGFIVDMIDGVSPLFHIDKDKFNTGATLLASVALITLMGIAPAQSMDHKGDGEQEKRITANLKAGLPAVLMDNINDKVMGGSLASMLTARYVSQRLLGGNENLVAVNRITWITTGTGTEFSKEVLRRVLPIFLDAGEADPKVRARRGDIKRPALEQWITENRAYLVWACHVLVRYALQNGLMEKAENYKGPIIDSFGRWCAVMGTLLGLIDVPGFLGNLEAFGGAKSDEHEAETEIVSELWKHFTKGNPEPVKFTAKRAWEVAGHEILGISGGLSGARGGQTEIGKRLNKVRGVQVVTEGEGDQTLTHRVRVEKTTEKGRARYRIVPA